MVTQEQKCENAVVHTLLAQGYYEIVTYTFLSPKMLDKIRLPKESPLRSAVEIINPLGEDTSVMRTSIFTSMMDALARNYNNRNPSAAFFELAKEFLPGESASVLPEEKKVVALGLYGAQYDFANIKGAVEALLDTLYCRLRCRGRARPPDVPSGALAPQSAKTAVSLRSSERRNRWSASSSALVHAPGLGALIQGPVRTGSLGGRVYTPLPRFPALHARFGARLRRRGAGADD